jgi:predicted ATPase
MSASESTLPLDSFVTFGDLLKYLRRRARLTQRELCIAVGYSEAQISRLEQNQRPPDIATLTALFIPALYVDDEPEVVARLMELAAQARGESLNDERVITFSRSVRREVLENVRTIEENVLNNLPIQLTSFIGREREIAEISRLLNRENGKARLVTLIGNGGCGKTRLALETAKRLVDDFRDGIWLSELAPISDPSLVLQTVASTLGIPESRDRMPSSTLTKYLRTKQTLLIFDNCEQVITATAQLAKEILSSCPYVQILGTSREILNIPGEVQFRVPALSLSNAESSGNESIAQSEAIQLFVQRAQAVLPSFTLTEEVTPIVQQICHLLDGMPLAIELAAARVTVLPVGQIATRLNDNFQLLGGAGTILPHHQTLDATIQWSYDLLSNEERALLQRLSVFSGGWTLEAAESVTRDGKLISEEKVLDLLSQLVNKWLVVVYMQAEMEARYRLLRVVQEYGYDRLAKLGEVGPIQNRHMDFFLREVEQAQMGLTTAQSPYWLKRLDEEQDNLRAALTYAQFLKRYEDALQLAGGLFWFWQTRGHISEGRSQLEKLLVQRSVFAPNHNPETSAVLAKALWAAGSLAWIQSDYGTARSQMEESISLWRQLEPLHKPGLAIALREAGIIATYQGELEYAHSALKESIRLLDEVGNKWNLALAFYNQGLVFESQNEIQTARTNFEKSQSLFRELNEPWGLAVALFGLGRIAGRQAEYTIARSHLEESLKLSQKLDDPWSNASTLYLLGEVVRLQGEITHAMKLYIESLVLNQVVGDKAMIGFALHNLGKIVQAHGELEKAALLFGAAQSLREDSTNTTSWSLTDHAECERDITILRNLLDDETFRVAWAKGQAMSAEDAIAYALTLQRD